MFVSLCRSCVPPRAREDAYGTAYTRELEEEGWNEERTKKGERQMERGGKRGKVGEVWRERIRGRIDPHDRSHRYMYTVKRESTRSACSGLDPARFRSRGANHVHRGSGLYTPLFLPLPLSHSTSPSAPFLLFRFAERVVSRPLTGFRSPRPVGQLRLHVPFDQRFRAKTRPTSRDRLPSGFDGFVSPLQQPRLGATFHGNGEYGSVTLTDRHFVSL